MLDIMLEDTGCSFNVCYTSVRMIGYARSAVYKSFSCVNVLHNLHHTVVGVCQFCMRLIICGIKCYLM